MHLEDKNHFMINIKKREFASSQSYDLYIYLDDKYNAKNVASIITEFIPRSSTILIKELKSPFNSFFVYSIINKNKLNEMIKLLKTKYKEYDFRNHLEFDDNYNKLW